MKRQKLNSLSLHFILSGCIFCFFNTFFLSPVVAQQTQEYDEIMLSLDFRGVGATELDAVIRDKEAYLSIKELFDFLKIKNESTASLDSISGFFLNKNNAYLIEQSKKQVMLQNKVYSLNADDLIKTSTDLYLKTAAFSKIFGLDGRFNFRDLTVSMTTKLNLPILQEKLKELLRKNIGKLNYEIKADTTVKRNSEAFNLGTADWAITSTQQKDTHTATQLYLKLGGTLAGGETTIALNHISGRNFQPNQQSYLWRYVNNESPLLKQIIAGKISSQSISSLIAPITGLQITNSSTQLRRSFGTYTISDYTQPEWTVELYINNVLVDYKKADASGFYTFEVPMVYGNTALQLRFFGLYGEESSINKDISLPYSFVPKNENEYTFVAGMLQDGKQSKFSRLDVKHGISRKLTMGTGVEYLSSIAMPVMPFLNASYMAASSLLLSADYTLNVRTRAILNYRFSPDLLVEAQYIKYKEGQKAILNNYLEERKLILTKQFKLSNFSTLTRLSINEIIYPTIKQTTADLLLSAAWKRVSANLTTYTTITNTDYLNIYSNLSLALALPKQFILRPQVQYTYQTETLNSGKFEVEKQLTRQGYLNITFENNFVYNTQSISLGLRLDLSFIRSSFSARQTNKRTIFSQTLSGGAVYDRKTNYLKPNNRINTGRGGLVAYPYLDLNGNNKRDPNEPKISGLKLQINGGRMEKNDRDTTIKILDLEPYQNYLIEIDPNSFDNIAWQIKNITYKVTVEPNQLKRVEIPVNIKGEVSGTVYAAEKNAKGLGRIVVNFYLNGTTLSGHAITESDGYFNFLGLAPGSYTARIDRDQLIKLKMKVIPSEKSFKIRPVIEGDVITDLDFKLVIIK